jgi:hypothetical protein
MENEEYVDTSKVYIREISSKIAKELIVKNHYSHAWTMCSLPMGIFYKSDKQDAHFDYGDENLDLIGVCVFGNPVGRSAAASFSSEVKLGEVYELTRLWIADGYGKNIESYVIAQCFKYIKQHRPHIKVILSYSDSEQGHMGGIYKATNAYYQGTQIALMPNFSISVTKDPYDWIHSRTAFEKFGSHNIEKLKKAIGHTFWRKQESGKHRYFWILTNKKEKAKILKTLKHPTQKYPTDPEMFNYPVTEHFVESKNELKNPFFD